MKAVAMSSLFIGRLWIQTRTSPPATVSPPAPPPAPPPAQPAQPTAEPICAAPGYGYRLPAKPQSATDVWYALHGLGPYENKPVPGGIPVMEKDHIGWEKMYTASKQRHFSCWNMTLKLMDKGMVLQDNADAALQELDKLFTSLMVFMKLLQKQKKDRSNSSSNNSLAPQIGPEI